MINHLKLPCSTVVLYHILDHGYYGTKSEIPNSFDHEKILY